MSSPLLTVWFLSVGSLAFTIAREGYFQRNRSVNSRLPIFGVGTTHVNEDVLGGPVLSPSLPSDTIQFDTGCVANPVVLPPCDENDKWQCYYYGNAGSWKGGVNCFLPTGWCGLAESDDGINWIKIAGKEEGASILAPEGGEVWDGVHVGVGDVVRVRPGELHMYYFGASSEEVALGPTKTIGLRMRIGRAKSVDGGKSWEKLGVVLDIDEEEGFFASWPRIIVPEQEGQPWRMLYHSFNGKKWRVFGAESSDCGDNWMRTGLVLEGGQEDTCFDSSGIGTRTVTRWREGLLMMYEGVEISGTHRIGAAYCSDSGGGQKWEKLESGEPIFEPGKLPLGKWTSQVIGTPYLVSLKDGSLRLYYCAKGGPDARMSIGVVISDSGNISAGSWRSAT